MAGTAVANYDETLPLLRAITNDEPTEMVIGYVPANHPGRTARAAPAVAEEVAGAPAIAEEAAGAPAGAEEAAPSDDEEDDRFKDLKEFSRLVKLEKDMAAAQMQAVSRGNSLRLSFGSGRLSSGSGEPAGGDRSKDAKEPATSAKPGKEQEAAAQMQAVARGRKARNEKAQMEKATTQMQAVARGRAARNEKQQMEKATTQLQAVARGRAARNGSKGKVNKVDEELSELLKAEIVAIFHAMDDDNDGSVTKEEASRFFKSFGKLNAEAMFHEVDVARSVDEDVDVITLAEWVGFWGNVKASGYSEDEMREELANMASGQSWVDFNDGRSPTGGELSHGTPPIPRRSGSPPPPTSFTPKRSSLVPEEAATASPPSGEAKAGGRSKSPLNLLGDNSVGDKTKVRKSSASSEKKRSLTRQSTPGEWLAEQSLKLISHADFQGKWTGEAQPGDVISKQEAERRASVGLDAEPPATPAAADATAEATGPSEAVLNEFVGVWRAAGLEGRDEFLKAMALPWIIRQIMKALPQPDNIFFRDDKGNLCSHSTSLGKTTEETYIQGGTSTKTFKGVTTTVTYHWDGKVLTYKAVKSGAPEEEASSRRWIEPDGRTMIAESLFRKNKSQPWVKLRRTWTRDPK